MQRHLELRKRIQLRFLGAPVETGTPVFHQLSQVVDAGTVCPWLARRLIREARAAEPIAQVGKRRIGDVEREFCCCHCLLPNPMVSADTEPGWSCRDPGSWWPRRRRYRRRYICGSSTPS